MKKVLYILIILLWPQIQIFGQENSDTIQFKSNGFNYSCSLNGKVITLSQLTAVIKTNPTSIQYLNAAKLSNTISNVFLGTGSFLVGYGIGYSIARKSVYSNFISFGLAIMLVDIPILVAVKENLQKSIYIYNGSIKNKLSISNEINLNVGITQNGIALVLKF